MEKHATSERSSIAVAGAIALIIIVTLVVLGLFARLNLPRNIVTRDGAAPMANAAQGADATPAAPTAEAAAPDASTAAATADSSVGNGAGAGAAAAAAVTDTTAITTAAVTTEGTAVESATDGSTATVAAAPAVDMATLNTIIAKGTCGACHTIPGIDGAIGAVGPNLATIGADAATRIDGYSAQEYLHESIVDPNAFVAPECPAGPCVAGIMLPNLADLLTAGEIDLVVGYLSTLGIEAAAPEAAAVNEGAPATTTAATADAAPVDLEAVNAIALKGTCVACHTIPGIELATGAIGPNLSAIGVDAATRIDGYSAEAYIRESILDPNAFLAPECPAGDCPAGLMLPNLADLLTPDEIDTMVAYLLTLDGSQ